MKQRSGGPGCFVNTCQVCALVEVASVTGQRQIFGSVESAMLPGDDVFYVEGKVKGVLREAAVFTTASGSMPHQVAERRIDHWDYRARTCRASDLMIPSKSAFSIRTSYSARSPSVRVPSLAFAASSVARA